MLQTREKEVSPKTVGMLLSAYADLGANRLPGTVSAGIARSKRALSERLKKYQQERSDVLNSAATVAKEEGLKFDSNDDKTWSEETHDALKELWLEEKEITLWLIPEDVFETDTIEYAGDSLDILMAFDLVSGPREKKE